MSRRGAILQDYGGTMPLQDITAARDAASYYQRDKEQANQMKMHQADQKKKEQGDATDFIGGLKADHVGDTTIDLYNDAQMKSLQDKLVAMQQKGAGVNEIKMAALPELQKIAQGYTIAKNEYGKIAEAQKNLMKDYPEGNAEAARNVMGKGLLENIYEYNPDGSIKGYKDPSLINSSKSYSDDLFDPEKMDAWYPNTTNEVVANIQKTRGLTPLKGQLKLINPKGGYTDKKYEGHISIYDTPITDKDGKITGISLDAENVPLGKNEDGTANVIQVMPKGKYDVLRGNGKSAMQFDKAVYNHISKDLGINPKSLDPQAYDIYSRNYALEMLRTTGLQGSSYNQFDVEKENPIKNITNITNKTGKDEVDVNNIYKRVGAKIDSEVEKGFGATRFSSLANDEMEVVKKAVEIAGYDLEEGGTNIYLAKDGDEYKVYKAEDGKPLPQTPQNEITTLSFEGANLKNQPNVATKKEVVKQGEEMRNKKAGGKVQSRKGQDGKTYTSTDGITWKASDGTTVVLQK